MTEPYNQAVARHYAAYRPPLHKLILKRVFSTEQRFSDGLDVGCGTGRSTVALAEFCRRVYAIDPSQAMLDAATPHEAATYFQGSGESIRLPNRSIDVVTFAGSLFYAEANATVREIKRVCRPSALIVPYDFEILVDDALQDFGVASKVPESTYNHRANLSGVSGFAEMLVEHDRIELDVPASGLAHILLADAARHDVFVSRYNAPDPFETLAADLESMNERLVLRADIFYATYRIIDLC